MITVDFYLEKLNLNCIYDLDLLDSEDEYSRLALPDGENSIWVCDHCGELADPDEGCECREDENEDQDEYDFE